MADKQSMLGALAAYAQEKAQDASAWWEDFNTFTHQADAEAERRFPNQARDESVKNAYRHALGTGRLAQLWGGNSGIPGVEEAAQGAAKLAGYGWEALGGPENWGSQDMRHDLNANAIGASEARYAQDFKALADALAGHASRAQRHEPLHPLEPTRGYFTYTK